MSFKQSRIIIALSFASLFISVVDNVRSRRHELALMRTMGGKPLSMFLLLILRGDAHSGRHFARIDLKSIWPWVLRELLIRSSTTFKEWALIEPEFWIVGGALLVGLSCISHPSGQQPSIEHQQDPKRIGCHCHSA